MWILGTMLVFLGGVGIGWRVKHIKLEQDVAIQHWEIRHLTDRLAESHEISPESPVNKMV